MSATGSPNRNKLLVLALGAGILGVAVLAIRPLVGDKPSEKKVETPAITSGDPAAGAAGTAAASAGTGAAVASAPGQPSGSSGAGAAPSASATAGAITSGAPVDMSQLLLEAKVVERARSALAAGDPKKALKELEFYDKIPNASSLRQEATLLKIEALSQVGRRAEARALAYATRDDPSFNTYQKRIDALLDDAGP